MSIPRTEWEVAEWLASQGLNLKFVKGEWLKFSNHWHVLPRDAILNECGERISTHITALQASIKDATESQRERILAQMKAFGGFLNYFKLLGITKLLQAKLAKPDGWDQHTIWLPTRNGKVNLLDGSFDAVSQADYITKYSPIPYDPDATCPRWLQFLEEITLGNEEMGGYLQRAVGYTLTGLTNEQVLFILVGPGSNGKNILLETLYELCGGHASHTLAHQTTFKVLERAYGAESAPGAASPHLAAMEGVRYVMASESHEGSSFNDGLVKSLTGDGNITARRLHQEEKVFTNQCKFWLACNNLPRVHDMSQGFWRRIQLIQLDRIFADKDKDLYLRDKLRAELPGILNWAIKGAIEWHRVGLQPPKKVKVGVEEYRKTADILSLFLEEVCVLHPSVQTNRKVLYTAYKQFVKDEYGHTKFWSVETLTEKLKSKGIDYKKRGQHLFFGVCLRSQAHNFQLTQEEIDEYDNPKTGQSPELAQPRSYPATD